MGASCSTNNLPGDRVPHLKIALVGDPEVGKTSVMLRYMRNQFSPMYIPTKKVAVENVVRKINIPGDAIVSLTVWDIPGQEDMDMYKAYFRDLDAAIVVVDLTNENTIEMAPVWKQRVLNNAYKTQTVKGEGGKIQTTTVEEVPVNKETFPVILLGTKYDVVEEKTYNTRLKLVQQKLAEDPEADPEKLLDEIKPEVVLKLEQVADEHNFTSSVIVSSKDADNTVHYAIQTLIRSVVEKEAIPRRLQDKREKAKREKPEPEFQYGKLDMTGIQQFDDVFTMADVQVKKVAMLRHYYSVAFTKFKEWCTKAQMVPPGETSLEDCIMGVKNALPGGVRVMVEEDEGFYKLHLERDDESIKLPKLQRKALRCYHLEFVEVCKSIVKECPEIDTALERHDAAIATLCKTSLDPIKLANDNPEQKLDLVKVSNQISLNRAKMQHGRHEAMLTLEAVEEGGKKIKASFIW